MFEEFWKKTLAAIKAFRETTVKSKEDADAENARLLDSIQQMPDLADETPQQIQQVDLAPPPEPFQQMDAPLAETETPENVQFDLRPFQSVDFPQLPSEPPPEQKETILPLAPGEADKSSLLPLPPLDEERSTAESPWISEPPSSTSAVEQQTIERHKNEDWDNSLEFPDIGVEKQSAPSHESAMREAGIPTEQLDVGKPVQDSEFMDAWKRASAMGDRALETPRKSPLEAPLAGSDKGSVDLEYAMSELVNYGREIRDMMKDFFDKYDPTSRWNP